MCLYVKLRYHPLNSIGFPEALTAQLDIPVYKVLEQRVNPIRFFSPHRDTPYSLGELKEVSTLDVISTGPLVGLVRPYAMVNRGLHAYRSKKVAMHDAYLTYLMGGTTLVVVPCIIPRGARYFIGGLEDIVTNRLLVGTEVIPVRGNYRYVA